jgi:hypothetical protein
VKENKVFTEDYPTTKEPEFTGMLSIMDINQ